MKANSMDFLKMISKPDYPRSQNALRLVDLPKDWNEQMIRSLFHGKISF